MLGSFAAFWLLVCVHIVYAGMFYFRPDGSLASSLTSHNSLTGS